MIPALDYLDKKRFNKLKPKDEQQDRAVPDYDSEPEVSDDNE